MSPPARASPAPSPPPAAAGAAAAFAPQSGTDNTTTPAPRLLPLPPFPSVKTPVLSVCLLHAGVVGCGTPSGAIKVIQPHGAMAFSSLEGHKGPVTGLAKLTGGRVASCSEDKTLKVFGTRVAVCESTIEPPASHAPRCIAGLPSGQIVAGCEDGNVRVYNPGVGAGSRRRKRHFASLLISALASLCPATLLTGLPPAPSTVPASPAFAPLPRLLPVCPFLQRTASGHSRATRALCSASQASTRSGQRPVRAASRRETQRAGRGVWPGKADDVCNEGVSQPGQAADEPALPPRFAGGSDGTVRLWRVTQVDAERSLTGHNCPVTAVCAVTLARLVSGGEDGNLRLWRASDGACLRVFSGHTGAVTAIALTPDTLRICSVSKDRTCRLWRENSPADEPPVILEGHDDEVTSIAVGMQWESLTPSDRFQAKRGCSRLC